MGFTGVLSINTDMASKQSSHAQVERMMGSVGSEQRIGVLSNAAIYEQSMEKKELLQGCQGSKVADVLKAMLLDFGPRKAFSSPQCAFFRGVYDLFYGPFSKAVNDVGRSLISTWSFMLLLARAGMYKNRTHRSRERPGPSLGVPKSKQEGSFFVNKENREHRYAMGRGCECPRWLWARKSDLSGAAASEPKGNYFSALTFFPPHITTTLYAT